MGQFKIYRPPNGWHWHGASKPNGRAYVVSVLYFPYQLVLPPTCRCPPGLGIPFFLLVSFFLVAATILPVPCNSSDFESFRRLSSSSSWWLFPQKSWSDSWFIISKVLLTSIGQKKLAVGGEWRKGEGRSWKWKWENGKLRRNSVGWKIERNSTDTGNKDKLLCGTIWGSGDGNKEKIGTGILTGKWLYCVHLADLSFSRTF